MKPYLNLVPWARLKYQKGSTYIYQISRDNPDFGEVALNMAAPTLHVRSGAGILDTFSLTSDYRRYVIQSEVGGEDNMFLYLDRAGAAYIDAIEFLTHHSDGSTANLLTEANSTFELGSCNWAGLGNHIVERVKDGHAFEGNFALKVVASGTGGGVNLASLTNNNYHYEGGPNSLVFYAKSDPKYYSPFLGINEKLYNDTNWLEQSYPREYARWRRFLDHIGIDPLVLTKNSLSLSETVCP